MAAADTLLLGHVGVDELAACALGNVWEWTWLCLGFGLVMGIEAMISQAHGRGDGPATALALQRGVMLAGIASVPIGLGQYLQGRTLMAPATIVVCWPARPAVPCSRCNSTSSAPAPRRRIRWTRGGRSRTAPSRPEPR